MTIGEIAEELGVSKTTVSRAISGKGRIGKETKDRILAYIKETNYKPNAIARGLAKSKTYNIGVVMPRDYYLSDMPFFLKCLDGIHEVTSNKSYDVLLVLCDNDNMFSLERIIDNHKVDGVILMRTFLEDKAVAVLSESNIPFVTIGSTKDKQVTQVDEDHVEGCKELTATLLAKGMRKIALLGGNQDYVVTNERMQGFKAAFEQMQMPLDDDIIHLNQDNSVIIEGTVHDIIKKGADCIVCMDDSICYRVLKKLKKEHIKVPEQIKVASFFNSTVLEDNEPSITSLSFDNKKIGMVAVQKLLALIKGHEVEKQTLLGYEVVLKESTK